MRPWLAQFKCEPEVLADFWPWVWLFFSRSRRVCEISVHMTFFRVIADWLTRAGVLILPAFLADGRVLLFLPYLGLLLLLQLRFQLG